MIDPKPCLSPTKRRSESEGPTALWHDDLLLQDWEWSGNGPNRYPMAGLQQRAIADPAQYTSHQCPETQTHSILVAHAIERGLRTDSDRGAAQKP